VPGQVPAELGFRVAGKLAWVHSASAGKFVLVTVHPKRGKEAMDATGVLPAFTGIACHDAWKPYDSYHGVAGHALCGAHYADTAVMPIPGGLVLAGGGGRACGIGIIRVLREMPGAGRRVCSGRGCWRAVWSGRGLAA